MTESQKHDKALRDLENCYPHSEMPETLPELIAELEDFLDPNDRWLLDSDNRYYLKRAHEMLLEVVRQ